MDKKTILENLLYVNEHLSCKKYMADTTCGFRYREFAANTKATEITLEYNMIIFILEGSCSISCDQYLNRSFFAGDMVFLCKSSIVDALALEDIKLVYVGFDMPQNPCDKQNFEYRWETTKTVDYDFAPLKMNSPMISFINSLVYYLRNQADCVHLHEIKHKELFLILRWFYTKEQFAEFFYTLIGKSFDFKNFVLGNYAQCNRLEELIDRSGMSASVFMTKFKKEFGISGYQWMLKQMCQKILHKASQPGVTIKDVMFEIGVTSPTHFNRICRKHFNKTPKELISFYQSEI